MYYQQHCPCGQKRSWICKELECENCCTCSDPKMVHTQTPGGVQYCMQLMRNREKKKQP